MKHSARRVNFRQNLSAFIRGWQRPLVAIPWQRPWNSAENPGTFSTIIWLGVQNVSSEKRNLVPIPLSFLTRLYSTLKLPWTLKFKTKQLVLFWGKLFAKLESSYLNLSLSKMFLLMDDFLGQFHLHNINKCFVLVLISLPDCYPSSFHVHFNVTASCFERLNFSSKLGYAGLSTGFDCMVQTLHVVPLS